MSELALTAERRVAAPIAPPDAALLRARAVRVAGAMLIVGALILLVLVESADVTDAGHPDAGRVLVRVASCTALLIVGTIMLAHVPRHPIGWLICAAALGTAVSNAGGEYATYAHFVKPLPASAWAGWVGEWTSAAIILIPAVALLLFPDGRLPSRPWRPALWCGLAATALYRSAACSASART